jgi:Tol biopolymer transport system component
MGVGSFAVSPDGRSVAYIVHDEHGIVVKVMDIREGNPRVVASAREGEPYSVFAWFFQQLAWWDDTHIAYYILEPVPREAPDAGAKLKSLEIVDLETGETTTEAVSTLRFPSPDGRYVLSGHDFRGLDPHYQPYQLDDRETGERWAVTDADVPARFLGWSPHGRLMLFDLNYEREVLDILVVVDAATRMRQVITPEGKTVYPYAVAWAPDGQTIAYMQCDPPTTGCMNPELWLSSPDGENQRRIPIEESMYYSRTAWAPDGSRLVFETTRQPHIWSVRLDGTDLRPMADGQDPQVLPTP